MCVIDVPAVTDFHRPVDRVKTIEWWVFYICKL